MVLIAFTEISLVVTQYIKDSHENKKMFLAEKTQECTKKTIDILRISPLLYSLFYFFKNICFLLKGCFVLVFNPGSLHRIISLFPPPVFFFFPRHSLPKLPRQGSDLQSFCISLPECWDYRRMQCNCTSLIALFEGSS